MISTMLSGTAGTSLRESRRPPARAPWPGSPHPAGATADPDTIKCASPATRQSPAQLARHLCPPAAPAATGKPARHAARPSPSQEPAPANPSPGQAPAGRRGYRHGFRGTAGRALRLDAGGAIAYAGSGNDRAGERLCLVWPSGDSRTTRAPSGCRQLVVLCRPRACTSPDGGVAGAALTGRMFSRLRRRRRVPHPARMCSPRGCGCHRRMGDLDRRARALGETGMVRCRTPSA
jgi:hypothetical protein